MVSDLPPHIRIAAAKLLGDAIRKIEEDERAAFAARNPRGTRLPVVSHRHDDNGEPIQLGSVSVVAGRTTYDIDPAEAIPYVVDRYGPQAIEEIVKIRPQYENSLKAEAKKAHEAGQPLPPGVTVSTAPSHAAWSKGRGVDPLRELLTMINAGQLSVRELLGAAYPELNSSEREE